MPFQHKRLVGPLALTTSSTLVYTVPASKTSIVKQVVVTNTTGSSATFTLRIGASTALFNAVTVAANDSLLINLSQVLATAETLYASASANTTLNLTISGVENDGPLEPTETYIADGAVTAAKLSTNAGAVMVFADSSARSTAIPSPTEGMVTYLQSTNSIETYNGSAWTGVETSNLLVAPTSSRGGMGIRQYNSTSYQMYVANQPLDLYGNSYVVHSNGYQTYVRGNNITMYAGDDVNDKTWVELQGGVLPRVRIAANYYEGFEMDMAGRVKMPYQPVFFVSNENGSSITAVNKHTFNYVAVNNGNHWSSVNNRFTAPVTGIYFFTMSILNGGSGAFYLSLRKNGTGLSLGYYPRSYTDDLYESNTASGYVSLASGDYIELWVETGTAHSYHSFFSGHLVA